MSHVRIFRHYIPSPFLLLGAIELILLLAAAIAGTELRSSYWGLAVVYDTTLLSGTLVFAGVLLASTMAMGVYSTSYREGTVAMIVRTVASYCLLGCAALTILYYLAPFLEMGHGVLAYSVVIALVLVPPVRWVFFKLVSTESLSSRVLVLGAGKRARQLEQRVLASHRGVATIVGYVKTSAVEETLVEGRVCSHTQPLVDIAHHYDANEIVVALDERRTRDGVVFPLNELLDCKLLGINVVEAVTFYERELGILEISEMRLGWMVFASGFTSGIVWDWVKRGFDIFVVILIALITWPFMLLLINNKLLTSQTNIMALLKTVLTRWPVLFSNNRHRATAQIPKLVISIRVTLLLVSQPAFNAVTLSCVMAVA
ncbi:hypothetical protein N9F42_01910 [Pseudomonadales bacterium]|nr:hypothetical protein [Pseudomonadales bacterium]